MMMLLSVLLLSLGIGGMLGSVLHIGNVYVGKEATICFFASVLLLVAATVMMVMFV